jgi:sugar/nucleoside kinase (ribokinase family)
VDVDAVTQNPGGSALNTAWHLAAQGVHVSLHAAVGRDRAATILTSALDAESKIADPSKTLAVLNYQPTASCVALHGPRVDRAFVSATGAASAANLAQLVPNGPDSLDVTHVHIGGFYVCAGLQSALPKFVEALKRRGVVVSADPNFDAGGVWRTPAALATMTRGPGAVDLLMPSEVEACEITGKDTAEEALEALVGGTDERRIKLAVIKRGAAGVLAGDRDGRRWHAPACTVARVVDTNGAGDAFNAGFLRVWSAGGAVGEALRAGCASAAVAAQHAGGSGAWAPDARRVDAQADAEYGDKPWWQKGVLACMAPRKLA